jgi:hypothetical protein
MKIKIQIKSVFEQIASNVFQMKNVEQAKQYITEFVNSKEIKDTDKQLIVNNVSNCRNILQIQRYICNALLKYEGMSVNKFANEDKKAVYLPE